jgi:hypothetical protein
LKTLYGSWPATDGITYFARDLHYDRKMFMKLMTGGRARNGTLRFFCEEKLFFRKERKKERKKEKFLKTSVKNMPQNYNYERLGRLCSQGSILRNFFLYVISNPV